jgi:hypothetical protein
MAIKERVDLKKGLFVEVKESAEEPPMGFIIDVFHGDELVNTYPYWYDDFEEIKKKKLKKVV